MVVIVWLHNYRASPELCVRDVPVARCGWDIVATITRLAYDAIRRTREERPSDYLKVAVAILPKQVKVEHGFENLTDEQMLRFAEVEARVRRWHARNLSVWGA
jgi:hypothetical protein